MQAKDVMTPEPACCMPETPLAHVAELMVKYDCGEIPVVENHENKKPVGVVTDRDIVCRTMALGMNPMSMNAGDIMSTPIVTVSEETSFEDCRRLMEEKMIRRLPVVNAQGACSGIIALADIAKYTNEESVGEIMEEVTKEIGAPSNVT